jgi:hypothetical protein
MTVKITRLQPLRLLITGFRKRSVCVPLTPSSTEVLKAGIAIVPQQEDGSSLGRISTELSERWDVYHVTKGAHTAFVKQLKTNYDIWHARSHSFLQQNLKFLYAVYFTCNFVTTAAFSSESMIHKKFLQSKESLLRLFILQ